MTDLTTTHMRRPDFIIVGTMKSGTNTIGRYLEQHDEVFMAKKEISYFSSEENYAKGAGWYASFFREAGNVQVIGERSPSYASYPQAPDRIHEYAPDAKLIWTFRDPAKRAYSQYWHNAIRGGEKYSFDKTVDIEIQNPDFRSHMGNLFRSRYVEQIERYLEFFPKEKMLFFTFEELKSDHKKVLSNVCSFLEIGVLDSLVTKKIVSHKTYRPRSLRLQYWNRHRLEKVSRRAAYYLQKLNTQQHPGYPPMSEEVKQRLAEYFHPYNQRLTALTNMDISAWNHQSKHVAQPNQAPSLHEQS